MRAYIFSVICTVCISLPVAADTCPIVAEGYYGTGPVGLAVVDDIAFLGVGNRLRTVDLSDPAAPQFDSEIIFDTTLTGVAAFDDLLLVATRLDVRILNATNPHTPIELSRIELTGFRETVFALRNDTLFVFDGYTLTAVDIGNPSAPVVRGAVDRDTSFSGEQTYIQLVDDVAYVSGSVIDISNTDRLIQIGRIDIQNGFKPVGDFFVSLDGQAFEFLDPLTVSVLGGQSVSGFGDLAVVGDLVYFVGLQGGLRVMRFTDPENPMLIRDVQGAAGAALVTLTDGKLLTSSNNRFNIFGLTDLEEPVLQGSTPNENNDYRAVAIAGDYVITLGDDDELNRMALQLFEIHPIDGQLNFLQTVGARPYDNFILVNNMIYAYDRSNGIDVIDVSDPLNAVILNTIPAYWQDGVLFAVDGSDLILAGYEAIELFDISTPAAPVLIASQELYPFIPGYYEVIDVEIAYPFIVLAGFGDGVLLVDYSDPENLSIVLDCHLCFTNDGGLALKYPYVYLGTGFTGGINLQVIDLSHNDGLQAIQSFAIPEIRLPYHLQISGDRLFVATNGGLRGLDISDRLDPQVVYATTDYLDRWRFAVSDQRIVKTSYLNGLISLRVTDCIDGDLNTDGVVDILDIDAFVAAFFDALPIAASVIADMNGDLKLDGRDISGFLSAVLN